MLWSSGNSVNDRIVILLNKVKRDPQSICGLYGQDSRAISTG